MSLNVKESVTALVLLGMAGYAWFGGGAFAAEARIFPRLVASVMAVLAFAMLVRSFFAGDEDRARRFFKSFPTFLLCLALITAYIYSTSLLGYFTASTIFIPLFAVLLGLRRPVVIIASTILFVVGVHLVFVEAFNRPLPVEFYQRR